MGNEVLRYFAEAEKIGGILGKVRLATLSRITSAEAVTIADTPDVIERLKKAMVAVKEQIGSVGRGPEAPVREASASMLRHHLDIFLELMSQRSIFIGDVQATSRRVTESAALALDCERVSVWFCDPALTKITCVDLFERSKK